MTCLGNKHWFIELYDINATVFTLVIIYSFSFYESTKIDPACSFQYEATMNNPALKILYRALIHYIFITT